MATDAAPPAPGYSPQLDGLRAVAVAAVAYSHWLPAWQHGVPFGAGVHLFFTLSGFLITRILLTLRAAPEPGRAVARFYARRALRLFPAFYVVLALAWLADVPLVRQTWAWHAAYLSNVLIAGGGRWLGHVSHFWSLAVEEQFYLVWPWVIVWSPRAWLGPLLTLAVCAGPGARLAAASFGLDESFWALVPGGSADSLALGALVAWAAWRQGDEHDRAGTAWPRGGVAAAAGAGWGALALADAVAGPAPAAVAVWRQVLQGVVFAWVVRRAVTGFGGPAGRVLAHPWLVYVGRISYGVYLIHAFAPVVVDALLRAAQLAPFTAAQALPRALAAMVMTLVLAAAMWQVVEAPFQRVKARLDPPRARR